MKLSSFTWRPKENNPIPNLIYSKLYFIKNSTYRSGFSLILMPARPGRRGN
jgi:hypothetical protein